MGDICMKYLVIFLLLFNCSCIRLADPKRDKHMALLFANIVITCEAQLHETPPPVTQTASANKKSAEAGLQLLQYEIDR